MYAIVKTGGKQYRVERGQRLLVERLSAAEGESVALQPILYRSEEAVFDKAGLQKVNVTAKVIAHERGEKLRVFKFKPKRGYKRRTGHRQELTRIEVTELGLGGGTGAKANEAAPASVSGTKAKGTGTKAPAKAPSTGATKMKAAPKAKASVKDKDLVAGEAQAKPAKAAAPAKAAKPKAAKATEAAPKEEKPDGA